MDPTLRLDALVTPLRADVVSGASVVARMAAEVVHRATLRVPADTPADVRRSLAELGVLILDAQPAMAPLVALLRDVLDALEGAPDAPGALQAARDAADAFRLGIERRSRDVAARAATLLPAGGTVLTLSSSSTVRGALLHGGEGRVGRVVVLESRPMQEGLQLAAALGREGVPATVAVDAAAATLVPECDLVLLGADSVGDAGVVNKLGSLTVALAAHRAGIPVMVVTDETKILPPGFPQHLADDRPAEEVVRPTPGVRVWNRYFEVVPLELVSSVVTEGAVLAPSAVQELRQALRVPEEIRRWAEGRL